MSQNNRFSRLTSDSGNSQSNSVDLLLVIRKFIDSLPEEIKQDKLIMSELFFDTLNFTNPDMMGLSIIKKAIVIGQNGLSIEFYSKDSEASSYNTDRLVIVNNANNIMAYFEQSRYISELTLSINKSNSSVCMDKSLYAINKENDERTVQSNTYGLFIHNGGSCLTTLYYKDHETVIEKKTEVRNNGQTLIGLWNEEGKFNLACSDEKGMPITETAFNGLVNKYLSGNVSVNNVNSVDNINNNIAI